MADMLKFVEGNDFQAAFGNCQTIDWNGASKKNLIVESAVLQPMILCNISPNEFKSFGGEIEANLFMDFAHNALQKALVTFATAAEKVEFSGIRNMREIVTQLKEQATVGANENCRGALPNLQIAAAHT